MRKRSKSSKKDSSREPHTTSEATASGSSHRPRGRVSRFLEKVKDGANKLRTSDSLTRSPIPQSERSSTPNLEAPPSGVQADIKLALQEAQKGVKHMHPLSGPATSVVSVLQDGQQDLDAIDSFQDTYLKPLKIFDAVIGELAGVHPYAKMALGVLSCTAKVILAQADRDIGVIDLLKKISQVYNFIMQDDTLNQILSMRDILAKISRQTRECANFIKNYSETKNFWMRLGKHIISETDDAIRKYNGVFDKLMQTFRDQVARNVVISVHDIDIHVHGIKETLNLSGITYAEAAGLDTRKECLEGTRTDMLFQITDWINSTEDNIPRVLWLSGTAGTGKSAIAHTIAKWCQDTGGLGSCYCFDRQREADRRHEKIFSTIARDLADHDPEMRRALADVAETDNALKKTADVVQQWQKLLIEPLEKSSLSSGGPITIVIDALDESGGVETRRDLLRILAGTHPNPAVPKITDLSDNLRFIVTSRPLRDILNELRGVLHIQYMSMDDIPQAVAKRDIHTYVSMVLEGPGFQDRQFAVLTEKADGLFEWARLACRYIKKDHPGLSPMECFGAVISRDPAERTSLLYSMYNLILTGMMPRDTSPVRFRVC